MTIEELNVLFYLRAELEWLNTVKAQLMDAATSTTAKLTGMPHGSDPRTRLVFRLRFFRALSWKEIAKITHTTTDTVKAIVYRYLREETRSTHGAKEGA